VLSRSQLIGLTILNSLRSAPEMKLPVAALLDEEYCGIIPAHTGGGLFGDAVSKLADAGFVKLFDHRGDEVTQEICSVSDPGDWTVQGGYRVAKLLRGREDYVFVSLTGLLSAVQSTLGISVTQLIEDFHHPGMQVRPIFGVPKGEPSSDVFVLMPFDEAFKPVFDDHIRGVCRRLNLACKRADDLFTSNEIVRDVWELIANSRIIVADCTGRNPNVFYELGIAHTLGKRVVIITQSADDIPFDIRHIRFIRYSYTPRGMKDFEEMLEKYISAEQSIRVD